MYDLVVALCVWGQRSRVFVSFLHMGKIIRSIRTRMMRRQASEDGKEAGLPEMDGAGQRTPAGTTNTWAQINATIRLRSKERLAHVLADHTAPSGTLHISLYQPSAIPKIK